MTERDVHIDCGQARSRASALRREANNLRSLVGEYQAVQNRMNSSWRGKSAVRFHASLSKRIDSLSKAASKVEEIASAIERTADIYETKQIAAIRAAAYSAGGGGRAGGGSGGGGGGSFGRGGSMGGR